MRNTTGEMLAEIRAGIAWLDSTLPTRVAGMEVSARSKVPFKLLIYRAALGWRFSELCSSALEALEREHLVTGILLTRGAVETAAGAWYLSDRLRRAVAEMSLGSLDDRLMRLLFGDKTTSTMPNPVHVNDFLDSVEKRVSGFREQYDRLCEFAHPNWAGTALSFSRIAKEENCAYFDSYPRQRASIQTQGVVNLSVALLAFRRVYEEVESLMPEFIALCERGLGEAV